MVCFAWQQWEMEKEERFESGSAGRDGILTSCLSLQKAECRRQSAPLHTLCHRSLCLSPPNPR